MNGVRYCQYDGTHIITDQSRLRRGARYCSAECDHAAALERRNARAEKVCRLCGRGLGKLADERRVRRQAIRALVAAMHKERTWIDMALAAQSASDALDSAATRKVRQSETNDSEACAAQAQEGI